MVLLFAFLLNVEFKVDLICSCTEIHTEHRGLFLSGRHWDSIMVRTKRRSFVSASFGLWPLFGKTEYNMLRLKTYPLISLRDNEPVAYRVGYWKECSLSLS